MTTICVSGATPTLIRNSLSLITSLLSYQNNIPVIKVPSKFNLDKEKLISQGKIHLLSKSHYKFDLCILSVTDNLRYQLSLLDDILQIILKKAKYCLIIMLGYPRDSDHQTAGFCITQAFYSFFPTNINTRCLLFSWVNGPSTFQSNILVDIIKSPDTYFKSNQITELVKLNLHITTQFFL